MVVLVAAIVVMTAVGLFMILFKRKHQRKDDRRRVPSICLSRTRYGEGMNVFDTYVCGAHIMLHSPEGTMRERVPSIVLGKVDQWYGSHESTLGYDDGELAIRVSESSDHSSFKL
ncbi:hypothetical protein DYB26_010601 [Aphanomyces astaci]|uniref:Uncharacterized protein n=1 Tax=Aphanomyces astaci TaxID=112090 RepID=A0A397EIM0_APHAT|nr:hypothetical protein DYB38_011135 [Aphanomyces astaci]RHY89943.1 hypothetical protein DYB26_010601 [Aphanomyces astaci]RHY93008.1 hypothetical protein DYB31_010244 [Aphanomyces astaci]